MLIKPLIGASVSIMYLSLSGCVTGEFDSGVGHYTIVSGRSVHCERAIKYQQRGVSIGATTFPGSKGAIKIGKVEVTPTTLRQTSDMIDALDEEQYRECQQAVGLSSDTAKLEQYDKANQTYLQMIQLVTAIDNSNTEQGQVAALKAAQKANPKAASMAGIATPAAGTSTVGTPP